MLCVAVLHKPFGICQNKIKVFFTKYKFDIFHTDTKTKTMPNNLCVVAFRTTQLIILFCVYQSANVGHLYALITRVPNFFIGQVVFD